MLGGLQAVYVARVEGIRAVVFSFPLSPAVESIDRVLDKYEKVGRTRVK